MYIWHTYIYIYIYIHIYIYTAGIGKYILYCNNYCNSTIAIVIYCTLLKLLQYYCHLHSNNSIAIYCVQYNSYSTLLDMEWSRFLLRKRLNSIFYPFFHSFSHTWIGAGNKKNSRHRTKGTEVEDHGWVSVAVCFWNSRLEVWIFFFCRERRAQVIWLTMGTATAGVFGPRQGY